jgi:hypothetical protein
MVTVFVMIFVQDKNAILYGNDDNQGRYDGRKHGYLVPKYSHHSQGPYNTDDHNQHRENDRFGRPEKEVEEKGRDKQSQNHK